MLKDDKSAIVSNVRVTNAQYENQKVNLKDNAPKCSCTSKERFHCIDVDATVLDSCPNTSLIPSGITTGVVAKIPVVLAEFSVSFNVSAWVNLPEPALEIKDIKKRVKITQCTLLQPTNILFIKGFIRKNIDYSTGKCANLEGICGELHHCTIDVPFECSTPISFYTPPENLGTNLRTEFEYHKVSKLPNEYFAEKDKLVSGDLSEFNQIMDENFNELPFCELVSARIYEFDEFIGRKKPHNVEIPFEEKFFSKIEEKMVIEFTIKLLQNRQVTIPASAGTTIDPNDCPC